MARTKRRKVNERVRTRRLERAVISNIIRSEPVIRVFDRTSRYQDRKRQAEVKRKKQLKLSVLSQTAPNRYARKARHQALQKAIGQDAYRKIHDCKAQFRRLLSWRSAQGAGRKRTRRELQNNKSSFHLKDC